jgi:tellurite resistance protein
VPVVAILLGGELARYWLLGGRVLVAVAVVVIGVLSAWSLAELLSGAIDARVFHPGYFLFTLAGGLIGAIGLAQVGARGLATVAFGVGLFFWAVLAAAVLARLVSVPPLPDAVVPTLAIFSVPPSVAGLAWFGIEGERIDLMQQVLLVITVFLLLSQLFLVRRYARVPFGLGYWSFTFTAAAPASYGIRWLWLVQPPGWPVWAWLMLVAVTAWIGWIAARSVPLVFGRAGARAG